MIARYWRGWATKANADAYETMLRTKILPSIFRVKGYRGAYILRREVADMYEIATITLWDNMESVKEFAGADFHKAVVTPEAQKLLKNFDTTSLHYEVLMEPGK